MNRKMAAALAGLVLGIAPPASPAAAQAAKPNSAADAPAPAGKTATPTAGKTATPTAGKTATPTAGKTATPTAGKTTRPKSTPKPAATPAPMTEDEKAAFALGAQMGEQAESITKQLRFSAVELAAFRKGLSTTMAGEKSPYVYEQYVGLLKARAEAGRAQETAATKAKGDAFREAASGESGATRTATGLVFRTLQPGQGESPKASDVVRVNYRGTLIDGTEFDASRGEASFGLDGVIPCWTEGVQLMRVGEKARLVCPPEIAYGDRAPGPIPAGSTLVFEVELVGIGAPAAEPTAAPEPKPATPTPEPKSATPTPEPEPKSATPATGSPTPEPKSATPTPEPPA